MHRAYSVLTIKSADDEARVIRGIATTPTPDRLGDIIEPLGMEFKNPIPLLWHHDSRLPVGEAYLKKATAAGIEFEARLPKMVTESATLRERIDTAWGEIKHGLIRGVSIGFKKLEAAMIKDTGGIRFLKSMLVELSLVTLPANTEATITNIKSFDAHRQAALGRAPVRLEPSPAGATASRQPASKPEGNMQRTLAEQIAAFETQRGTKSARMEEIQAAAIAESRSKNEAEREEFDGLSHEIEMIDEELKDLRRMETIKATTAQPVRPVTSQADGALQRGGAVSAGGGSIIVKAPPKLELGVEFARIVKVAVMGMKNPRWPEKDIAASMYGGDSEVAAYYHQKAAVPAGTTLSGNWAANLISPEGAAVAAFMEFLRPATILGKFGTNGIPALNEIAWRAPFVTETGAGAAWWVGEGAAKPVTQGAFTRDKLEPTKLANICVLSMENVRDSSPKSDLVIRNMLRNAIVHEQDYAFIQPTNAGTANVKPAAITNGADFVVSAGDDAAAIRLDVRSLIAKFTGADNPPSSGVWIMSSKAAAALGTMVNPLGQPEFPTMSTLQGGTFFMMPVIVSDVIGRAGPNGQAAVGDIVVLLNARDIFLAQDDGIQIDQSDQVSLQMDNAPTMSSATPTAASVVSMWQTNSIAIRAEHAIGWKRGRASAVTYLTSVDWGGPVNT